MEDLTWACAEGSSKVAARQASMITGYTLPIIPQNEN